MTDQCCETTSCSDMLCALMAAYTKLIAGQGVQEVEFDGDRTRYHSGNIKELHSTLMRLHTTCGNEASAALLGINGRRGPLCVRYGQPPRKPRC